MHLSDRTDRFLIPGAIVLLVLIVYAKSLGNGFVTWDDGLLILENPIVRSLSPSSIFRAFSTYDPELYIPLTLLSYQINYALVGYAPFLYHLTNVALHAINAVLVFLCLTRLSGRRDIGFLAALLFAVHPLNVETVAWASARKDLLSAFFFLGSFQSFLRFHDFRSRRSYAASVILFLFGLLSKVNIVVAPVIFLLCDWRSGRPLKKSIIEQIPFFALSILFGIIALFGKAGSPALPMQRILIAAKATVFYLTKFFVPTNLSVLYPYTESITLRNPELALCLAIVIALTIGAFLLRIRLRDLAFGWAFFLIFLIPTFSNITKGRDLLRDIYFGSDRYAYLALIGLLLPVCSLLLRYPKLRIVIPTAIVILFSILSFKQSLIWKDTESLFANVLQTYPNSHIAHNNIASILYDRGEIARAKEEYGASLAIRPNAAAFYNVGQIAMEEGRETDAIASFRSAIATNPFDAPSHANLGALLMGHGTPEEAMAELEKAVGIDPNLAAAHFNLGILYAQADRKTEALAHFKQALAIDPADSEARDWIQKLQK